MDHLEMHYARMSLQQKMSTLAVLCNQRDMLLTKDAMAYETDEYKNYEKSIEILEKLIEEE